MKAIRRTLTWVMGGMLALGATSCSEEKAGLNEIVMQADATKTIDKVISTAQAVEWATRFQRTHSKETWGTFTETQIFEKLLAQKDCQGLRIYHATEDLGANTFVLVGVDGQGHDLTNLVADDAPKGPPCSGGPSVLETESSEFTLPGMPAGDFIPLDRAVRMTQRYHKANPDGTRAGFFSSSVFRSLLDQPGCIGIHIYKGLKEDGTECFILVGIGKTGVDMTEGLLYGEAMPCPSICSEGSPLVQ